MEKYSRAINEMYKKRDDFLVLGLTGRTGSGCSKVAEILRNQKIDNMDLPDPFTHDYNNAEERKYQIIYNFLHYEGRWKSFVTIEVSAVILSFVFDEGYKSLVEYIKNSHSTGTIVIDNIEQLEEELNAYNSIFEDAQKYSLVSKDNRYAALTDKNEEFFLFYTDVLIKYKKIIQKILKKHICYTQKEKSERAQLYTFLLQTWANNIRSMGNPYKEGFSEHNYYDVAKRIEFIIDIVKKYSERQEDKRVRVCIDALRTPYEVTYLRDTYKAFHLISVNADEQDRIGRLAYLSKEERESLDRVEFIDKFKSVKEQFYHQNIQACIEMADIHIYNPDVLDYKYFFLTRQILKYIALMLHPGLVTPSHIERCMQLAYNAKINSACLSRQVGAVITGSDFSIRAVGWNDVATGQTPCALRDIKGFCRNKDVETYSEYERSNVEFNYYMKYLNSKIDETDLQGRMCAYCFKDVYNGYTGKDNQVYTRSLHAEENAFLQITKYGGTGIKGGFLFTTASPCELCAKKAYQLGITNIYYIEIYPGISAKHILSFGTQNNPKMCLFFGAIGNAYISLYEPRMATKDELELMSGINLKNEIREKKQADKKEVNPVGAIFDFYKLSMEMESREKINTYRHVKFNVVGEPIERIVKSTIWTGSRYLGTTVVKPAEYTIKDSGREHSPHKYSVEFNKVMLPGSSVEYEIMSELGDDNHEMEPYLSHTVNDMISSLSLSLTVPKGLVKEVVKKVYRGFYSNFLIEESPEIKCEDEGENERYSFAEDSPQLYHTYCLEWKWK